MTIYQNNVPQANDIVSESQSDFQTNHIAENTFYGFDHTKFNDPENPGIHKKVTYFDQNDGAGGGQPTTTNSEIALYAFRNDNNIANPYRVNLRAKYQNNVATEDVGIAPFASAYFGFISPSSPSFLNFYGPVLNIDETTSKRVNITAVRDNIEINFVVQAANTNYFVWAQYESIDVASMQDVAPQVVSKAQGSFILAIPAGASYLTSRIIVNIYEN